MRAVIAAGWWSAIRLVRHPLVLAGYLAGTLFLTTSEPPDSFQTRTIFAVLLIGPTVFFATNLTAARERRAGTIALATVTPTPERQQTASTLLAVLGPTAAVAVMASMVQVVATCCSVPAPRPPTSAEMAVQVITVLGAGLLGVMTARWLPFPGGAAIVFGLLVIWPQLGATVLRTEVWWAYTPHWDLLRLDPATMAPIGYHSPATIGWRLLYLCSLCAMASIGALLATPGPRRLLLGAGTAAVMAAALTGWHQVP